MDYKKPYNISLVYLVVLLAGSIIFYKERMLFVDPAFITFEIMNTKSFIFSEHRYGAFITQVFPLMSVYFNASIDVVLILYSVSFYLFYLFVAYVSGSVLQQKLLAILFIFYLCFFVSDVYFWPNNEIHQSAGWMILFLSVYRYSNDQDWKGKKVIHLSLICTLFLAIISHMLILVPLTFLWLYIFWESRLNSKQLKYFLFYTVLILLFAGLRYYLSHDSWYDGAKLQGIKQVSFESILLALKNDHSVSISKLFMTRYWPLVAVFIGGLLTLIYKNKYTLAVLTIFYALVYYLLVVLTYADQINESNLFYFESQWMGLSLIVCVPFLFETIKHITKYQITIGIFFVIFMLKITHLSGALSKFQSRLSSLQTLVDDARDKHIQKSYLFNTEEVSNTFLLTWGIPIETALLSSMKAQEAPVSIKIFDDHLTISASRDSIYTAFKLIPISNLNAAYFKFSTNNSYQPLVE